MTTESRSWNDRGDVAVFVGAIVLPLVIFAALAAAVVVGSHGWDNHILRFAQRYYDPSIAGALDETLHGSIVLGAVIVVGAVTLLLARDKRAHALLWILSIGGALALDLSLKEIFQRPFLGDSGGGYSFPSGNAMAAAAILASVALTCPTRWRTATVAVGVPVVMAYGAALVYEWWHYPSDVVAGWCVAVVWVTVLWRVVLRR